MTRRCRVDPGEQAKMHLIAMKTALPSLRQCRVAAKEAEEERQFVREMSPIVPDVNIEGTATDRPAASGIHGGSISAAGGG